MTPTNYGLVALSAVLLAYGNFVVKRVNATQTFVGLSKVAEGLLLLPMLVLGLRAGNGSLQSTWPLPVVGAALVLMSHVLLASAYRHPGHSLINPISRGATLLFLPPAAYFAIGEVPDGMGGAAIAVMVIGIILLPLHGFDAAGARAFGRAIVSPSSRHALLAGLLGAGYTLWDKRAVQLLQPATYFAAYSAIVGIVYFLVLRQTGRGTLLVEWRRSWPTILLVAIVSAVSSLLLLVALRTGHASYVIALRQLSLALGAGLGARWLGEALPAPAVTGIGFLLAGCVMLALAG
jgi:uncharacterized membrane protein